VNTIAPGYMETGMTEGMGAEQLDAIRRRSPSKKLVSPDDVAGAVAYLLSPEAAMVNGSTITVDAGSTA
jgi:3-oxoacyl-[acyl-carrier protein] reductase